MFDYPVTLSKDGNSILVTFKDLPEAITFGTTKDEALLHAVDALESALSFYVDARKALPKPSKAKKGQLTVTPSALESAKLGIYQSMLEQGMRKTDLAKRLGWHLPQVDRLFDLSHASKFEQIEAAAHALGKSITLELR